MKTASMLNSVWALVIALVLVAACGGEQEPTAPAQSPAAPRAPLVEKTQVADWCPEHGVPESVCTRCNSGLVDSFKKNNDWCTEHDLPDSQCFTCHPELEAKFKAMAPAGKR